MCTVNITDQCVFLNVEFPFTSKYFIHIGVQQQQNDQKRIDDVQDSQFPASGSDDVMPKYSPPNLKYKTLLAILKWLLTLLTRKMATLVNLHSKTKSKIKIRT